MSQTCSFKENPLLLCPSLPTQLPNVLMAWAPLEPSDAFIDCHRNAPQHFEHGRQPLNFDENADCLQDYGVDFTKGRMTT